MKVPTIDFCKPELKPGTTEWDSTKSQVCICQFFFFGNSLGVIKVIELSMLSFKTQIEILILLSSQIRKRKEVEVLSITKIS